MPIRTNVACLLAVTLLAGFVCIGGPPRVSRVIWRDFDMKDIPEPAETRSGFYEQFFERQTVEQWKRSLDVARLARGLAGRPKQAGNVNSVDEVPDSSWFTNRHHLRPMNIRELVRGPNRDDAPDFTEAVITRAKVTGITPGVQLRDRNGDTYIVKFDPAGYPELQSGAEVITTKIFYAAGYNVPENYIAILDIRKMKIAEDVDIVDETTGEKRPLTHDDLDRMLSKVARRPDGRYRVLASKFLSGKPKGPFIQVGIRADDPNDLIPHEHRRELRGLHVICTWLNHWDMKEDNSLDMYVEENGRKFLKHYLIDFGSSLGGGFSPLEYFHGREYIFDSRSIVTELVTLGFHTSAAEKSGALVSPAIGIFSAKDFDPGDWKPTFRVIPFDNMTDVDAFWATRIILSFSEPELRAIVGTAQYSNPRDTDYMVNTLLERRRIVASHWLKKVNPIAHFGLESNRGALSLTFDDLVATDAEYTYQITANRYKSDKKTTRARSIIVDRDALAAAQEYGGADASVEIELWTRRDGSRSGAVKVHLYPAADKRGYDIRRISRSNL